MEHQSAGCREFTDHAAVFEGARHDFSPKVFLGYALRSRGKAEGEEALDILAKSPATAHHIAFELAQYFVADDRLRPSSSCSPRDFSRPMAMSEKC